MKQLTPKQQQKLDKIQALLAKANDTGVTDSEAESFTDKAFALASKYMIDEAFIQSGATSKDEIETRPGEVGRPFNQLMSLANIVYMHFGCKVIKYGADPDADVLQRYSGKSKSGTKYRGQKYAVTGFTSDLDQGLMLLTSLLVQGARRSAADYRREGEPRGERRSTYYRSWWAGFTSEIYDRLERAKQVATVESNRERGSGTELVLASRFDLVAREVAERHGKITRGRRSGSVSGGGYGSGQEAGRRADLGGKKIGGSTRAIGS